MPESIKGEVLLENKQFVTSIAETTNSLSDLSRRFEAVSHSISSSGKAAFQEIAKSLGGMEQSIKSSFGEIEKASKQLQFKEALEKLKGLSDTARQLFSNAVGVGGGFEAELNKIGSISGIGKQKLDLYGDSLRKLAGEMGSAATPAETARIAYEAFSSNFDDMQSASQITANSLKLIADGAATSGDAAKLLTGALNAYGQSADQASKFTDILFQTQNFGATTIQELAASFGLVTSTGAAAGISFEELSAALATTTIRGINTSSSVEGLRGLLIKLIDPTKESIKAQERYGVVVNASALKQKGLLGLLREIRTAVKGDQQAFNDIAGSAQAFQVALALTNDSGAKFAENLDKMKNSAGAADKAIAVINQGLDVSKKQFQAALESFQIGASKTILPVATAIIKAGTAILYAMDAIPGPIKTAALVLTGLAGAVGLAVGTLGGLKLALSLAGFEAVGLTAKMVLLSGVMEFYLTSSVTSVFLSMGKAMKGAAIAASASLIPALSSAGAFMGSLAASISLGTLAFTGLGLVFGGVILGLTKIEEEASAAGESLRKATDLREHGRSVDGKFKTAQILGKSAADLKKEGIGPDTILQNALNETEGAEQIRNNGGTADQINRHIQNAHQLRKLAQEVRDLKADESEIVTQTFEQQQKAATEDYKNKKQAIELSDKSHKDKIAEFEALRHHHQLTGDEERDLNTQIHQERTAMKKEEAEAEKKNHKEALNQDVQEIENSKAAHETKIVLLKALIQKHHLIGEERRSIEDKVFAHEEALDKKRIAAAERQQKRIRELADTEVKESERKTKKLEDLQEKGLDTSANQVKEIKVRLKSEKSKIDSQAESDVAKETDPDEIQSIKDKAKRDQVELERAAQDEITKLTTEQGDRRLAHEQKLVNQEIELSNKRFDALKAAAEDGRGSQFLLNEAILDRLKLIEAEIQLQADLKKAQTEDPREIAQIEADAQASIIGARRAAQNEIKETNRLLDEQKKKTEKSKEFNGDVISLEQFLAGEHQRFFGDENTPKPKAKKKSFLDVQLDGLTRDAIEKSKPRNLDSLRGQGTDGAGHAASKATRMSLDATITLLDNNGKKVNSRVDSLSLNGENSDLSDAARLFP